MEEVILKFFKNDDKGRNKIVSRTTGKLSFVSDEHAANNGPMPKAGEFWRCRIRDEINQGENRGCFLVEPVQKIAAEDVARIPAYLYTKSVRNGCVYLTPKSDKAPPGVAWILTKRHRSDLLERHNAHAVILEVDGEVGK